MEFISVKELSDLLQYSNKDVESFLIKYIIKLKEDGKSYRTIISRFSAVKKFYKLNDILINDSKILSFIGEKKKTVKDIAYTHDEIKRMLEFSNERIRMIILLFASTGIRLGALVDLKLRHITKISEFGIYKIIIYENSSEEYFTYCTPECAITIDNYLQYRQKCGETLKPNSPLLREEFDTLDIFKIRSPRHLSKSNIGMTIYNTLLKLGLREANHQGIGKGKDKGIYYKRTEKQRVHAFRKFYNTQMIKSKVDRVVKERLMGHTSGLDDSYFTPEDDYLLKEYVKAIDLLTINEEHKLRLENTKLKQENEIMAKIKIELDEIRKIVNENLI